MQSDKGPRAYWVPNRDQAGGLTADISVIWIKS
jgi:hypothetical protein